jgi:ABC transporter substrate binding protein
MLRTHLTHSGRTPMRRQTVGFLGLFVLSMLVAPLVAEAQQKAKGYRLGYLWGGSPVDAYTAALEQGLRDLGWFTGQTIAFEYRYAEGHLDRLPALAAELVGLKVDAIVAKLRDWHELLPAAHSFGIVLESHGVRQRADFDTAFANIRTQRPDALLILGDPLTFELCGVITDFAAHERLAAVYPYRECVEGGGLLSYGVYRIDLFRRAAGYVDKILKGAKPAELPVEQPTKFEFVINLKTAQTLGLTVPPTLLFQADEVIR